MMHTLPHKLSQEIERMSAAEVDTRPVHDFSRALLLMRGGDRMARRGWLNEGRWVALASGHAQLASGQFWNEHARRAAEMQGGKAEVNPYFIVRDEQGCIQMGWTPSQNDMLANDWVIL